MILGGTVLSEGVSQILCLSQVVVLNWDGLVVSMLRPLGMGTIRPCWKEVGT